MRILLKNGVQVEREEIWSTEHILGKVIEGTSGAQWTQPNPPFQGQIKKGEGPLGQIAPSQGAFGKCSGFKGQNVQYFIFFPSFYSLLRW